MRVHFLADYDWRASRHSTVAFKRNYKGTVKRAAGEAAIAAGVAIEIKSPPRKADK